MAWMDESVINLARLALSWVIWPWMDSLDLEDDLLFFGGESFLVGLAVGSDGSSLVVQRMGRIVALGFPNHSNQNHQWAWKGHTKLSPHASDQLLQLETTISCL